MKDINSGFFVAIDIVFSNQTFAILQTYDARPLPVMYLIVLNDRVRVGPDIYAYTV